MKVLIVNKFLYPNGGSETYIFKLGEELLRQGCEVEYFGMEDSRNIVGNSAGAYTSNMDFHSGRLSKLLYPFKIIYSAEARRAIRRELDLFKPDAVHLNNFNFQLTPSIIYEIRKYERQTGHRVRIIFTAHDYQLICPNHMLRCPREDCNCEKCLSKKNGAYINCIKGRCIHGSVLKSFLGALEGRIYRMLGTYRQIDAVVCPSAFMKTMLDRHPDLEGRTIFLQNFSIVDINEVSATDDINTENAPYAIYFGRYSKEKGVETLLEACQGMPKRRFIFAGAGPLEEKVNSVSNIKNMGFLTHDELKPLVEGAVFSVLPSEWYENCPFSVMESVCAHTPVIGAAIGGIPELVKDGISGKIFESGNADALKAAMEELFERPIRVTACEYRTVAEYTKEIMKLY